MSTQMDIYREAIAIIDSDYPGQAALILADFIDRSVPHDPEGDEYAQRVHAALVDLCKIIDRSGLPRPPSMRGA